ncbi:phospholipase D-like domain-containing protein [Roseomonas sp. E05]|uniref:phospholipase D-like domain-containing protein n=1 Tax=Roseomonas sp. E05 TaxID=3046310 RepID=UPI0024BBB326|nr:phospholipase D-like domain-containing protein [Roseomonas sp. E05]MDJ0389793.1 phospholipase D-like domain-containing protein [Roseomonas sp. E05]
MHTGPSGTTHRPTPVRLPEGRGTGAQAAASLLVPGETCWALERTNRFAVIIDGADYFRAAKAAILKARHHVLLIGWDFDARVAMEPERQTLPGPNRIGRFLNWIARERPDLQVRILKWDLGFLRTLGRGETPFFLLNWLVGRKIRLKLDGAHPAGAAHHMKLMIIDDALAFCGGIDMTVGRWDTRAHRADCAGRTSPRGSPLGPWHDATTCADGPLARRLAELARERWHRATGERLDAPPPGSDPWPDGLVPDFLDAQVGIARTIGAYKDYPQVCEVEALTFRAIAAARRTLYIESQYFASRRIAEAIAARLREPDGPEVVIINPDTADGWLEAKAMDSARSRLLRLVQRADRHGRFRIFHPVNAAGQPIYVHAKILCVDDMLLKIGSANLNNRSLGYDTECDVAIEAAACTDPAQARALIARQRDDLLAEHLGQSAEAVAAALEAAGGSLIGAIAALDAGPKRLLPLHPRPLTADEEIIAESDLVDPERPTSLRHELRGLLPG